MSDRPVFVSLGYNCEISFRIEDYFGELDSYLFSWSFEDSRRGFVNALKNLEDVFTGELELCPNHMILDKKYQMRFHPRYDILPKTGETTDEQYEKAVDELKSRIDHLKTKTLDLFNSGREVVFIMKVEGRPAEKNIQYLKVVRSVLDGYQAMPYKLIAVFEKKAVNDDILALEDEKLKIRSIRNFAPLNHTDIMGDVSGWHKIFKEFAPLEKDVFSANVFKRRKKIIPLMVINKIKKILGK